MIYPHTQQGSTWRALDQVRHFALFLFVTIPLGIIAGWRTAAASFEAEVAVISTLKNITKPLFQDYTREGRIIGIFLRLGRIVIGSVVQVLLFGFYCAVLVLWYIVPFYLTYQIIRNGGSLFTS